MAVAQHVAGAVGPAGDAARALRAAGEAGPAEDRAGLDLAAALGGLDDERELLVVADAADLDAAAAEPAAGDGRHLGGEARDADRLVARELEVGHGCAGAGRVRRDVERV